MIKELGHMTTGLVTDKHEDKIYIQKSGITYELQESMPADLGQAVTAFAYIDRRGHYKMTLNPPQVQVGQWGWGQVVKVRKDLGVFVDIGLKDKDMVVSMDDLPSEKHIWPDKGDYLYIQLEVDSNNRMWAKVADEKVIVALSRRAPQTAFNDDVRGRVYDCKLAGSYVLTHQHYLAFIHPSEREREPRLGEEVQGRIIKVHPDGNVNMSLLARAHETLEQDAAMIYEVIKRSKDGSIAFTDKSDPQAIRDYFGISKGQFKRSVGRLMKLGLVDQDQDKTYLLKSREE